MQGRSWLELNSLLMLLHEGSESISMQALVAISQSGGASLKYLKTHSVKLYQLENPLHLHTSMMDSLYSSSWFFRETFSY